MLSGQHSAGYALTQNSCLASTATTATLHPATAAAVRLRPPHSTSAHLIWPKLKPPFSKFWPKSATLAPSMTAPWGPFLSSQALNCWLGCCMGVGAGEKLEYVASVSAGRQEGGQVALASRGWWDVG